MEINNLQNSHNQSSAINNPQSQKIVSDEINTKEQETLENSDKTVNRSEEVNISAEGVRRSSSNEETDNNTSITNPNQAREATEQFNEDSINDPSSSLNAQTGNIPESLPQLLA